MPADAKHVSSDLGVVNILMFLGNMLVMLVYVKCISSFFNILVVLTDLK